MAHKLLGSVAKDLAVYCKKLAHLGPSPAPGSQGFEVESTPGTLFRGTLISVPTAKQERAGDLYN